MSVVITGFRKIDNSPCTSTTNTTTRAEASSSTTKRDASSATVNRCIMSSSASKEHLTINKSMSGGGGVAAVGPSNTSADAAVGQPSTTATTSRAISSKSVVLTGGGNNGQQSVKHRKSQTPSEQTSSHINFMEGVHSDDSGNSQTKIMTTGNVNGGGKEKTAPPDEEPKKPEAKQLKSGPSSLATVLIVSGAFCVGFMLLATGVILLASENNNQYVEFQIAGAVCLITGAVAWLVCLILQKKNFIKYVDRLEKEIFID